MPASDRDFSFTSFLDSSASNSSCSRVRNPRIVSLTSSNSHGSISARCDFQRFVLPNADRLARKTCLTRGQLGWTKQACAKPERSRLTTGLKQEIADVMKQAWQACVGS